MFRQEKDITFANDDVIKLAVVEHLQHHVTLELVEELFDGIVVEVGALVRASDDEGHHVGVLPDLLVAHGWLQQMSVLIDPPLEIECSQFCHRRLVPDRP